MGMTATPNQAVQRTAGPLRIAQQASERAG
jgi:hypothetical protein